MAERGRAVYCEVAKRSRHRAKRLGSFSLPIGATQPQVGLVAPTQKNVAVLDLARDVLWMTKEVREWSFDHTHAARISEVLQKSSARIPFARGLEGCGQIGQADRRIGTRPMVYVAALLGQGPPFRS
jgi:hypothetical protein